jgi:antitoxin YefM
MYNNLIPLGNSIEMKATTLTDFRQKMKKHLEYVRENDDVLVLTGPKNKDFVVVTLENYNSMAETLYLFSTSANIKRLMESIEQERAGKATVRELIEDIPKTSTRKKPRKKKTSR